MIRYKVGIHKDVVSEKYPTVWDFFRMSSAYLKRDYMAYCTNTGNPIPGPIEKEFVNALCEAYMLQDLKSTKIADNEEEEQVTPGY